jgi:hypothetical protein
MTKLRLGPIPDDKPVTRTVKLPAALDAELRAYAEVYASVFGAVSVERLIPAMLEKFIQTDRAFRARLKAAEARTQAAPGSP